MLGFDGSTVYFSKAYSYARNLTLTGLAALAFTYAPQDVNAAHETRPQQQVGQETPMPVPQPPEPPEPAPAPDPESENPVPVDEMPLPGEIPLPDAVPLTDEVPVPDLPPIPPALETPDAPTISIPIEHESPTEPEMPPAIETPDAPAIPTPPEPPTDSPKPPVEPTPTVPNSSRPTPESVPYIDPLVKKFYTPEDAFGTHTPPFVGPTPPSTTPPTATTPGTTTDTTTTPITPPPATTTPGTTTDTTSPPTTPPDTPSTDAASGIEDIRNALKTIGAPATRAPLPVRDEFGRFYVNGSGGGEKSTKFAAGNLRWDSNRISVDFTGNHLEGIMNDTEFDEDGFGGLAELRLQNFRIALAASYRNRTENPEDVETEFVDPNFLITTFTQIENVEDESTIGGAFALGRINEFYFSVGQTTLNASTKGSTRISVTNLTDPLGSYENIVETDEELEAITNSGLFRFTHRMEFPTNNSFLKFGGFVKYEATEIEDADRKTVVYTPGVFLSAASPRFAFTGIVGKPFVDEEDDPDDGFDKDARALSAALVLIDADSFSFTATGTATKSPNVDVWGVGFAFKSNRSDTLYVEALNAPMAEHNYEKVVASPHLSPTLRDRILNNRWSNLDLIIGDEYAFIATMHQGEVDDREIKEFMIRGNIPIGNVVLSPTFEMMESDILTFKAYGTAIRINNRHSVTIKYFEMNDQTLRDKDTEGLGIGYSIWFK